MDAYSGNFGATRSSKVMDGRVCGVGMVFLHSLPSLVGLFLC